MPAPVPSPPEAWPFLLRLTRTARLPLERFLRIEAASGIVLLSAAAFALAWANSRWASSYFRLWETPVGLRVGSWVFERSLGWWVNDGLMTIFFFVVGLEIRRELHQGELSVWKRAALPVFAAFGGMVMPACVYLVLVGEASLRRGWGIPTATDIAFAVGILTLLGRRVPAALRVLLLALAVIDDLGAIVVIALFYSTGVAREGLTVALAGLLLLLGMRAAGVRSKLLYVVPGAVLWAGIYGTGVHPTIAGVLVGLLTPVRAWLGLQGFVRIVREELDHLTQDDPDAHASRDLASYLRRVNLAREEAVSPAEALIERLHPWVAFVIMPLFALANAGVSLQGTTWEGGEIQVTVGVAVGLLLGKPLGVLLASVLVIRLGIAALPRGLGKRHLVVLGTVAGVGFTMALFVTQLAFTERAVLAAARLGVLSGSLLSSIAALVLGRTILRDELRTDIAPTADAAERSTEL